MVSHLCDGCLPILGEDPASTEWLSKLVYGIRILVMANGNVSAEMTFSVCAQRKSRNRSNHIEELSVLGIPS